MIDNTVDERVTHVFQQQAAGVEVPPPDPRSVLTTTAHPRMDRGANRGRYRFVLLCVIALLAGIAGGVAILWASPGTVTGPAEEPTPIPAHDRTLDFDTQVGVRLQAVDVTVDTNGRTFSPTGTDVELRGDPGHPATDNEQGYKTLELTWIEHEVEMRTYLYFASNGTDWWVNEIRTYDGTDPGEWITMPGEYARTPIGQPFVGDLDVGPLHIGGMVLEAFVPRLTDCDGSGRAGQLHLELSGPRPVTGPFGPGGVSGYATTVAVLDAATCEPLMPDGIEFRAVLTNPAVAGTGELSFDPSWAPDQLYVGIDFVGVGETVLTVEAVDQGTGDVVASVDIPVTVTESGES